MNISQALKNAYQKLNKKNIKSAHLDAELLLSFVLSRSREYILAHSDEKLTAKQVAKFNNLIKQRTKNIPIAYLTSAKEFYERKFYVDEKVLIPRPETELIINNALYHCEESRRIRITKQPREDCNAHGIATAYDLAMTVIDIGTGSGCIIITLARELQKNKNVKFFATDISKNALAVANKNASLHKVSNKIKFLHGNLLEPMLKNKNFLLHTSNLLLLCNLPYLTPAQVKNSPSIKHEPKLALTAGTDGLKYYRELAKQIKQFCHCNPIPREGREEQSRQKITLICEIDPKQTKGMKKYFLLLSFPSRKLREESLPRRIKVGRKKTLK